MNRKLFFRDPAKNAVKTTAIVAMLVLLFGVNLPSACAASANSDSVGPDNALFTQVLRDYVKDGVVNYKGLKADRRFADYITLLQKTDPNAISKNNRLAFWINVYNAFVLKVVCDKYPIKSILSKTAYALKKSNFHKKVVTINGMQYSLNDVENDIIRPFGDPRIHFAINCAAKSCPPLRFEAFEASRLGEQMDEQARNFLNDPAKNSFDFTKKEATLSKIFDWFKEDFDKYGSGVLEFSSRYLPAEQGKQLRAEAKTFKIKHHDYNWDLNE